MRLDNYRIGFENASWLADVLGLPPPRSEGIDISDGRIGIEVKSRSRRWNPTWTVHEYQVGKFREAESGHLYWAFILYGPSPIRARAAWLKPWSWVRKLQVSNAPSGPYIYVPQDRLNEGRIQRHTVEGGFLYLPRNARTLERLVY